MEPPTWASPSDPRYASVSAGDFHIVWLRDDGRVVAAGDNRYGQYLGLWALGRSGLEKPMENPKSSGLSLFPHKNWHHFQPIWYHMASKFDSQHSAKRNLCGCVEIPDTWVLRPLGSEGSYRELQAASHELWVDGNPKSSKSWLLGAICDLPRRSKKHRVGWFVWDLPMPRFPSPSHHHLYVWDFIP